MRVKPSVVIERQGKLCECGCGKLAPLATRTNRRTGTVKGEPQRFIRYHQNHVPTLDHLEDANGCWIYQGHINRATGYGSVGRTLAHRRAYEEAGGVIPEGKEIDHLCRVRACINPDHLEPVTRKENVRRSPIAGRHKKLSLRKLTDDQVRLVRSSTLSNHALARELGVSHESVRKIRAGEYYKEVA